MPYFSGKSKFLVRNLLKNQSPHFSDKLDIGKAKRIEAAMTREELQLVDAKRAYKNAQAEGNRQEEARWANVIGNALKNRGEYVEALKWFRIDYEITIKHLPEKHLLPTCQSLGEIYLRLEDFKNALTYQVFILLWNPLVFLRFCRIVVLLRLIGVTGFVYLIILYFYLVATSVCFLASCNCLSLNFGISRLI